MKRREEAVALFELASGAFLSLNPDEVIRLTVASLSRELEFDRVQAFRFHPESREVEELQSHGLATSGEQTRGARRPLDADELLLRCLSAHGPVFDDEPGTGRGRPAGDGWRAAHAGDLLGFDEMRRAASSDGSEARLAQEPLAAPPKMPALDSERRRKRAPSSAASTRPLGAHDVVAIVRRTVGGWSGLISTSICA
jgi:hypothetical protein